MHQREGNALLDKKALAPLCASLHSLTGLPVGVVLPEDLSADAPGGPVVVGTPEICARWHVVHPPCLEQCRREARTLFLGEWGKAVEPRFCALGLRTFAAPVIVQGRCEALLFAHAFFLEGDDPEDSRFARQARTYGFPEEAYLRALRRVPFFSLPRLETLQSHLVQVVALLAERGHLRASLEDSQRLLALVGEGQDPRAHPYRRILDGLASRFSHECRTPLAAIRIHAERQIRRLRLGNPPDPADLEESLEDIRESASRLEGLIRRSPLSWGGPEPERVQPLDLEALVRDAWRLVVLAREEASSPILDLHVSFCLSIQGVPHRMFQIFVNLLHNAWNAIRRAGAAPGRVTVRSVLKDHQVEILVEDDGDGFPPGDRSRLLLPLFDGGPDQAGVGLSIVASLLEDQGGSLDLQDRPPRGARVVLRLPLSPVEDRRGGDVSWPSS